jgi:hypothetical protein
MSQSPLPACELHARFLLLLPRIELHGRIIFRYLECADRRADALAEMRALAWLWFIRLVKQGRDPLQFPSSLAVFAARAAKSGRRLTGQEKAQDVMSPRARQCHRFRVEPLPRSSHSYESLYAPPHGQQAQDALEERLRDNTQTPVPEQVAFRLDFPAWLCRRSERDRRVIEELILGAGTREVADKHGLSPARISQLRREFMEDWSRFCEPAEVLA